MLHHTYPFHSCTGRYNNVHQNIEQTLTTLNTKERQRFKEAWNQKLGVEQTSDKFDWLYIGEELLFPIATGKLQIGEKNQAGMTQNLVSAQAISIHTRRLQK